MASKTAFLKVIHNPLWGFEKAYLIGRSALTIKDDDLILAGFPKTGSTWIRYFLYCLLKQRMEGFGSTIDDMNDAMPEYAHPSFFHPWKFEECPRIIKTHRHCLKNFRDHKAVLVVRDPRDIAVSFYHHVSGMKQDAFQGTVKDVIKHPEMGMEAFFKHFESWNNHAGLVLRYEDLKTDPVAEFGKLADYFGITNDTSRVESAVNESDFSAMTKAQEKSHRLKEGYKEGHKFVRSGKKAQWKDVFDTDDMAYFENLKKRYNFELYE